MGVSLSFPYGLITITLPGRIVYVNDFIGNRGAIPSLRKMPGRRGSSTALTALKPVLLGPHPTVDRQALSRKNPKVNTVFQQG
jgi:hypothetical protein